MSETYPQSMAASMNNATVVNPNSVSQRFNGGIQQAKSWWLSSQRNLILSAVIAAIVAALIVVALWSSGQSYRPLYGLQERFNNAEIMAILDAEGMSYQLDDVTGQILVADDQIGAVRMLLAAKGVKAQLPTGLESLADKASLGTSQFVENARYHHGLEGELARTIISLEAVANARVHLAIPRDKLFVRQQQQQPTASIFLELKPGQELNPEQVESIVNLVAGSITGMSIENVSVVDQYGHLLSADIGSSHQGRMNTKFLDYQKQLEKEVIQRASAMLTPIVGANNYRVQVTADVDFNQVNETQEILDPQTVIANERRIQDSNIDNIAVGIPGSLSNQPPTTEAEQPNKSANTNERSEVNVEYLAGSRVRHTQFQQGQVNKLSVSVLLNSAVAPNGQAWSPQEKADISTMLADALGISQNRGDSFSLQTFAFAPVAAIETAPAPSWWQAQTLNQPMRYVMGGLLGLALILFVLRPLIRHLTRIDAPKTPLVALPDEDSLEYQANLKTANEQQLEHAIDQRLADKGLTQVSSALELNNELLPPPGSPLEIQLKHLQLIATEEPERVAEVLKQWIYSNDKNSN